MRGHIATECDEENESDRRREQDKPWTVRHQIAQVLAQRSFLGLRRQHAFLRIEEYDEEAGDGRDAIDRERHLPATLDCGGTEPTPDLGHGKKRGRDHDTGRKRAHELDRRQRGALLWVRRDYTEHGSVWNVDRRVDQHERVERDLSLIHISEPTRQA